MVKKKYLVSYKDESEIIPLVSEIFNLNIKNNSLIHEYTWWKHDNTNEKYPLRYYKNKRDIKYIVLHYTATICEPKNGLALRIPKVWNNHWNNNLKYEASADFGVDEDDIVQYNPDLEHYHCFATSSNSDKISIEMCNTFKRLDTKQKPHEIKPNQEQWGFSDKVLENTKKLILELYNKFGELEIITHYDVPRKDGYRKPCPGIWGWNPIEKYDKDGNPCGMNDTKELDKFKQDVHDRWESYNNRLSTKK
jgi:hypothetical protein